VESTGEETVRASVCPRRNSDQRPYKVVMSVAGDSRGFAIVPSEPRAAAAELVERLELERPPGYVVGFAPGGIALAVAVAGELDVPAVIAYKTRLGLPNESSWTEPHCYSNTFYFYGARAGDAVLMIDDEVDSGNTIGSAVELLQAHGVQVLDVGAAVEVVHGGASKGQTRLADVGLTLKALRRIEVDERARTQF